MTSAEHLDSTALARLGSESMRPVELNTVLGQEKIGNPDRPLPVAGTGFLQIDSPSIVLVTWKRAEDTKGTILRLLETSGHPTAATLHFPHLTPHAASLCNAMEDDLRKLEVNGSDVKLSFQPNEVLTVRIVP